MDQSTSRLHICLGVQCNNNCLFCMEEDRAGRSRRLARISAAEAEVIMTAAPGRDEVMFTAGEPTLRDDLGTLLALARGLGYRRVGLITNGRRLGYAKYLGSLLRAGLNHLLVSVHGHEAKLHDGLTRTPGAFEQVVAGLSNIQQARRGSVPVRFSITCVLNKRNLPAVKEMISFFASFGPDEVIFNAVQPLGRGEQHFHRLVPTYSEMVEGFARGLEGAEKLPMEVRLLDVPLCMTVNLPPRCVGFVEQHSHFEPETEILDAITGAEPSHTDGTQGELALVTKEELDMALRKKGPLCPKCIYYDACDGVWEAYVKHYGFDEFKPVQDTQE